MPLLLRAFLGHSLAMYSTDASTKFLFEGSQNTIRALVLSVLSVALLSCEDPAPPSSPSSAAAPEAPISELQQLQENLPPQWQGKLDLSRGLSADARLSTFETLIQDAAAARGPADGGGRAWITDAKASYPASSRSQLHITYEAGPLGIVEGGVLFLQPSPFWGWDSPQTRYPESPGYTQVSRAPDGLKLSINNYGGYLAIEIGGRALLAGEQIQMVYGAGPSGAQIDAYAEAGSPIYISVDGDGDGVRGIIDSPPEINVVGTPAAQLHLVVPTTARPGETVELHVSALDSKGSMTPLEEGGVVFVEPPAELSLPQSIALGGSHQGSQAIEFKIDEPGLYRFRVQGTGSLSHLSTESGPLLVREEAPRIRWGDLHGHSKLSDGTATPDQYFQYARDVAGLDVSSLTDHDHWGMVPMDAHPEMWDFINRSADAHHDPGKFVTVHGYEWTSWLHGHRHVLYFDGPGEVYSSVDPDYQTPAQLWDALRGQEAMTLAHHSAGGPVATNWRYPPDPILEPVTEIVSVHGSSESADSPSPIYDPVSGNYVRNALDAGYVLGFIGSGDSHDGHPGLPQLAAGRGLGGLAAILSEELSRDGVLEALRARRSYATNGSRIFLDVKMDGQPMGHAFPAAKAGANSQQQLEIEVHGTGPIERIDLIRSGATASLDAEGRTDWTLERSIPLLMPGEYHYVRVVQKDGGAAWSSPFFVERPIPAEAAANSAPKQEAPSENQSPGA